MYVIDVTRLRELPATGATVPVLCYGPAEALSTAWAAGCSDYLKEPWTNHELHFRIEKLLSAKERELRIGEVVIGHTQMSCGPNRLPISAQERKILALLCRHPGVAVHREALYYAIWGKTGDTSRVVDMHISKLRRKLAELQNGLPETNRIELKTLRGEGYALD